MRDDCESKQEQGDVISIVILKLPTVKGKRDRNIFLLVFEILNCYNLDKFNRINYSKIEKANHN